MKHQIKILLIEDDSKKIEDISSFIQGNIQPKTLTVKESYQSGIKELLVNNYDLLLLDMSIPTFDKTPVESGGPYQKFGGFKILSELSRKKRIVKTILITMFDDFGESDVSITLSQINTTLTEQFPESFVGSVFYLARENKWKEDLTKLIESVS